MSASLALVSSLHMEDSPRQTQVIQRVVLYSGELYRVSANYGAIQVRSGIAYITQAGRDRVLNPNQVTQLDAKADIALISALNCEQAVLELYSSRPR